MENQRRMIITSAGLQLPTGDQSHRGALVLIQHAEPPFHRNRNGAQEEFLQGKLSIHALLLFELCEERHERR